MGAEPGRPTSCPDHKDRYSPRATRSKRAGRSVIEPGIAMAEPVRWSPSAPASATNDFNERNRMDRRGNGGIGTACARVLAEDGLWYMRRIGGRGHHVPGGWLRCR